MGAKSAPKDKPRKAKRYAYLIAVKQRREAARVYALLAPSPEQAISTMEGMAADGVTVELTGKLSKLMAASLKLKSGEPRLI